MGWIQKLAVVAFAQVLVFTVICCDPPSQSTGLSPDVLRIRGIAFVPKKPDFGGEACVTMYLQKLGWNVDQDFVFDQANLDPSEGRGCNTSELVAAVKRIGIDPGQVWYPFDKAKADLIFAQEWKNLQVDIEAETPWVVCLEMDQGQQFMLVFGFDPESSEVVYHNPGRQDGSYSRMDVGEFRRRWVLSNGNDQTFLVKLRMTKPTKSLGALPTGFTDADYAQHIRKLKTRMPEGDFKIVVQKPFVVIGDEDLAIVKRRATDTVGWAAKRLKEIYFSEDPNEILDVWLFKDKESYNTNTKKLIGRKPTTPFGFYTSYHQALIMNISTGGGTLVHEIVHPFVESNFAACPSWFNEGFASLYEQCRDNEGKIWGSTNWRLRGLQLAIRDDRVPSFEKLCSTTRDQFYDQDRGTNYAQARYLCYYLQEHGKLVEYYETFRDNVESDPTGIESLKKVLGRDDLTQFKKDWQDYVMKLRF